MNNKEETQSAIDLAREMPNALTPHAVRLLVSEIDRLKIELHTKLLEYNDEVTQFNAGLKAGQEGKLDRWNDQPDYEPDYDVWILGYEAGSFNRLTKQIEDLRDEGDQIKQANWNFAKEFERLNIVIETQKEELDKRATVHDEKITEPQDNKIDGNSILWPIKLWLWVEYDEQGTRKMRWKDSVTQPNEHSQLYVKAFVFESDYELLAIVNTMMNDIYAGKNEFKLTVAQASKVANFISMRHVFPRIGNDNDEKVQS